MSALGWTLLGANLAACAALLALAFATLPSPRERVGSRQLESRQSPADLPTAHSRPPTREA